MEWLSRIQIGADIATGITIIGAVLSWYVKSRADARKARQRGINDAARAIAVQSIQDVLSNLSKDFNKIVVSASQIERRIDIGAGGNGGQWRDRLVQRLAQGNLDLDEMRAALERTREQISDFYELAAASRYTLFPSLSSLPESEEVVSRFKSDYLHIGQVYNSLSGGKISLLRELSDLVSGIEAYKAAHPDHELQELVKNFYQQVASIVVDDDYLLWVTSFLPDDKRDQFKQLIGQGNLSNELFGETVLRVLDGAATRGNDLIAQALMMTSVELQSARKECKEFMIMLAAISSRLQSKDNGQTVPELIELLQSETYFALDKEIR